MDKSPAETVAKRLQDRLDAAHPTRRGQQSWLAKMIGMKPQGIQSILSGAVERPKKIKEMAEVLKTSQAYLLGETDDPSPEDMDDGEITDDSVIIAVLGRISFIGPDNAQKALRLLKGVFSEDDETQPHTHRQDESELSNHRRELTPSR